MSGEFRPAVPFPVVQHTREEEAAIARCHANLPTPEQQARELAEVEKDAAERRRIRDQKLTETPESETARAKSLQEQKRAIDRQIARLKRLKARQEKGKK